MLLKRLPPFFAPVALALAGAGAACASCVDESSSTPDGGLARTDGRVAEAGTRDARDAQDAEDTGTSDWSWLQGQWDPLPAPYDSCPIRIAKTPSAANIQAKWNRCSSAREGCFELDRSWSNVPGRRVATYILDPITPVLGRTEPVMLYRQLTPDNRPPAFHVKRYINIVATLAGEVLRAEAVDVERTDKCISWAGLGSLGSTYGTFLYISGRSTLEYRDLVSNRLHAVELQPPFSGSAGTYEGSWPTIFLKDLSDRWLQISVDSGTATQTPRLQGLDGPRPVKTGFISRNQETGYPILHIGHDGSIQTLLTATAPLRVSGYAVDHTDNERLVWVESEDSLNPSQQPVMYTSPWADREANLTKRRVTAFDVPGNLGGGSIIVANGHALIRTSITRARLIRLSDGAQWSVDADLGSGWAAPMWVDNDELWFVGAPLAPNGVSFTDDANFYRIRRDTLGAPTPAR
jgi:hypothetical protein